MTTAQRLAALGGLLLACAGPSAWAEKADRDKPVNIEADRVAVDDVRKLQVFEGNVVLVKGTLVIRAARIVVAQDAEGYQKGVATGTDTVLPRFRQKREGVDEYMEGEAERIEHDAHSEKTEFFNRAWVRSGLDEVRGQYIAYDGKNEHYVVTSGPHGTRAAPGSGERVRAVIQPKDKNKGTAPASESPGTPPLKGAPVISNPRQETQQ